MKNKIIIAVGWAKTAKKSRILDNGLLATTEKLVLEEE